MVLYVQDKIKERHASSSMIDAMYEVWMRSEKIQALACDKEEQELA